MVRELFLLSALIGGVAVMAPMVFSAVVDNQTVRRDNAGPGGGSAVRDALATTPTAGSARRSTHEVMVGAAANGHFYLEAGINHAQVEVMLDTGASIVALRESDAAAAGIRPHRNDYTVPLSTANGTSYGAAATIEQVVIDHIEVRNVRAVVIPDNQLSISLLGTSFLNRVGRFEISGDTLIIED